jgi:YggT family protein
MGAANEILVYLIQTVLSLFLIAVVLRFLLQLVRADFYNPISQFLVKVTNPALIPLRKIIPGTAGIDVAAIVLALAVQLIAITAVILLAGYQLPGIGLMLVWSVLGLLGVLVNVYFFALLAMIILSWVAPGGNNPALFLLHQVTEPVMAPFRKIIPPMGGLDFSPIVVFILINIIQIALRHMGQSANLPGQFVFGL